MTRRVLIVAHPEAFGMELLGVRDILDLANHLARLRGDPGPYLVEIGTHDGAPVQLFGGLTLSPVRDLRRVRAAVDTLVVVGGPVAEHATALPALVTAVRRLATRSRRVAGVCTGAFLLAAAGVLDGRRATTHWEAGERLAGAFPQVQVDTDPIYLVDGHVWTSAGVTSGFDMLLAMVEQDTDAELARQVARMLVLHLRRSGGQSQFSVQLTARPARRQPLRELQQHIADHPDADLSLGALAARLHMSPRHFARVFTAELGMPPGRYVEKVRIDAARRMLEDGALTAEAVASAAGFGNGQAMRRSFVGSLGVTPTEYRRRFGAGTRLTLAG